MLWRRTLKLGFDVLEKQHFKDGKSTGDGTVKYPFRPGYIEIWNLPIPWLAQLNQSSSYVFNS